MSHYVYSINNKIETKTCYLNFTHLKIGKTETPKECVFISYLYSYYNLYNYFFTLNSTLMTMVFP